MAKDIYESESLLLTEFCGPVSLGNKRKCLQITTRLNYISLSYNDIKILISELQKWIDNYDSTTN